MDEYTWTKNQEELPRRIGARPWNLGNLAGKAKGTKGKRRKPLQRSNLPPIFVIQEGLPSGCCGSVLFLAQRSQETVANEERRKGKAS